MKRRTKQEVLSAFRCGEILRAARRVFARKGFARAGIGEIAREAGIAKGTVYLYFPSKDAVYWSALEAGMRELHTQAVRRVKAAATLEAKIRAFAETKLRYFDEHRDFLRIYHAELGNALTRPSAANQEFTRIYREQVGLLATVLRAALRRGEIRRVRPEKAAAAIFEITRGLIVQRLLTRPAGSPEADATFVVDLVLKGLRTA
jgi:TetR/AcrR family fatty acid metabolism transcriptional regulator